MAATPVAAGNRIRSQYRSSRYAYRYIAPALIAMVVASFIPIVFTIYISFTSWDLYHPALVTGFHWAGLTHYKQILDSLNGGELYPIVVWTIGFAAITTIINFALGLFLAYLLNNPHMPERNLYRTILILPWALPGTIMILAWSGLLNTDFGQVNAMLGAMHIPHVRWLEDPFWAHVSILIVNTWLGFPFMMTACLGALQSIPGDVVEASMVDGANLLTRFAKIIFPLLRSATLPLIISTFAYNLNNFGVVYLLTQGNPVTSLSANSGATDILPTYTYKLAITYNSYALSAAFSVAIFFFIGSLSLFNMRYSGAFSEVER